MTAFAMIVGMVPMALALEAGSYEETGEIFSEMTPLRFVGKKVSKIVQGILNDFRVLNDAGHTSLLKGGPTGDSLLIVYKNVQKCQLEALFAKPQILHHNKWIARNLTAQQKKWCCIGWMTLLR